MKHFTIALLLFSTAATAQPNAQNDATYLQHTAADAKLTAKEVATRIADRILTSTT